MRPRGTVSSLRRWRVGSPGSQKGYTFTALDQQLADFEVESPRRAPAGRPPYTRPGWRSFALSPLSRRPLRLGLLPRIPGRSWDSGRRRTPVGNHGIRDMPAIPVQKDSHAETVNPAGP